MLASRNESRLSVLLASGDSCDVTGERGWETSTALARPSWEPLVATEWTCVGRGWEAWSVLSLPRNRPVQSHTTLADWHPCGRCLRATTAIGVAGAPTGRPRGSFARPLEAPPPPRQAAPRGEHCGVAAAWVPLIAQPGGRARRRRLPHSGAALGRWCRWQPRAPASYVRLLSLSRDPAGRPGGVARGKGTPSAGCRMPPRQGYGWPRQGRRKRPQSSDRGATAQAPSGPRGASRARGEIGAVGEFHRGRWARAIRIGRKIGGCRGVRAHARRTVASDRARQGRHTGRAQPRSQSTRSSCATRLPFS